MRRLIRWLPYVLLVACVYQSHRLIPVWVSDVALWSHAAQIAPLKPRPAMNYGAALVKAGQRTAASDWLGRAVVLSAIAPAWDREQTQRRMPKVTP